MGPVDAWYVVCESRDLSSRPLAAELRGQHLVLFRDGRGNAVALLDRCPHRNVPLSLGAVRDGQLECAYHGWRFDQAGSCMNVPCRAALQAPVARVPSFATREHDGYVWAWAEPSASPAREPYALDRLDRDYTVIHRRVDYEAGLHASIENTIDVPHTVFLHRGLFRQAGQSKVRCTVTRAGREVRAAYRGEARPDTWLARLLAPGGHLLEHEDRFIAPCVVRVEYRVGPHAHLLSTALFTPLHERRTRVYARVAYRLARIPGGWLRPILERVAKRVLHEDAAILKQQTANIARFGAPSFNSTELDLFSSEIARLLEEAEQQRVDESTLRERHLELLG